MEEVYYIHVNGRQAGPFKKDRLIAEGMTADTMVWRPGLSGWVEASSLPELALLFHSYNQPPQNPYGGQQEPYSQESVSYDPYRNRQGYNSYNDQPSHVPGTYPPGWTNWLGWAITATVLGFFCYLIFCIPGIIGIVKANEANTLARMGDPRAYSVNSTAKAWTLIGLIISGIIWIIAIFALIITGVFIGGIMGAANAY